MTIIVYAIFQTAPVTRQRHRLGPAKSYIQMILCVFLWLVCSVVFYFPSTAARSFRDDTPFTVPCEGREAR